MDDFFLRKNPLPIGEFKNFITSLLKRGKMSSNVLEILTDDDSIKQFKKCFIDRSANADASENYELPEFVGDSILNTCIVNYIREWNPKIVSVKYLTRLKHNLQSKGALAKIAEKHGFWNYLILGTDPNTNINRKQFFESNPDNKIEYQDEYLSYLEDTLEAFIGTLYSLTDKKIVKKEENLGLGYVYCYRIMKSFLSEINISLEYVDVFDPKTIFKEVSDRNGWTRNTYNEFRGFAWNTKFMDIQEVKDDNGKRIGFECIAVGYPLGDRTKNPNNLLVLSKVNGRLKDDTESQCAREALQTLKHYGITPIESNPYESFVKQRKEYKK
jgi:dsRNA-specific ribonuclease